MPYQSSSRLSDLLLARGDARARNELSRGQAWGQALGNIGAQAQHGLSSFLQHQADAPRRELEALQVGEAREDVASKAQLRQENAQIGKLLQSSVTAAPDGRMTVDRQKFLGGMQEFGLGHRLADITAMLDKVDPPQAPFTLSEGQARFGPGGEMVASHEKAPAPFTLSQGQQRFGPDGQPIASIEPAAPRPVSVAPGGRLIDPETGRVVAEGAPRREPQGPTSPVAVMGPDGQPVYVRPRDAYGRTPANLRDGRPVTSGDAGRIAELDTSLDDLKVLRGTVSEEGSTGTYAKVGAAAPNWVTEWTGFGADAKSKQGVIDRVKQVIGKALEGGVLRKEDEIKYEKILPTISDVPDVVATKLDGLENAIRLRRERQIEALADAGYDVSKFLERGQTDGGVTVGSIVTHQGQQYRVVGIVNGDAELEPVN